VATAATIVSKPDLVNRFVAATIRGMKDAFADPTAAGAIMKKIVPQVDATVAKKDGGRRRTRADPWQATG
jgi:NitT/TauT family transport system substrate-binding protein